MQARFFKDKDAKGNESDMVEITNPADRSSVILPATEQHKQEFADSWDQHAGPSIGNSQHNASIQTTDLPTKNRKADNPANDGTAEPKPKR